MINFLTADGSLSFLSKILSKTFPADGLHCWPNVHFFVTFHVAETGSSTICVVLTLKV